MNEAVIGTIYLIEEEGRAAVLSFSSGMLWEALPRDLPPAFGALCPGGPEGNTLLLPRSSGHRMGSLRGLAQRRPPVCTRRGPWLGASGGASPPGSRPTPRGLGWTLPASAGHRGLGIVHLRTSPALLPPSHSYSDRHPLTGPHGSPGAGSIGEGSEAQRGCKSARDTQLASGRDEIQSRGFCLQSQGSSRFTPGPPPKSPRETTA